jgi:hypothetical protein
MLASRVHARAAQFALGVSAGLQYFAAFAALALLAKSLPGRRANKIVLLVFSLYPIFALIGPLLDLWNQSFSPKRGPIQIMVR